MKRFEVLIVCSGNKKNISPFITEQIKSISSESIHFDIYPIKGQGFCGYLKNIIPYRKKISTNNYDLVHAHFGLSGFLAGLQRKIPIIVTFHGSDISNFRNNVISSIVCLLAAWIIVVNSKMLGSIFIKPINNYSIIPCGINLETFYPFDKFETRKRLRFNETDKIIVFSSSFTNPVKNYTLAKLALANLKEDTNNLMVIELQGKNRNEVNDILNAADLLLMTSFSEGSPQIIKEAMACNCPIVSTDVGDVKWVIGDVAGCFLISKNEKLKIKSLETEVVKETSEKIQEALKFAEQVGRTKGRERIIALGLDSETIAKKVIDVYNSVLKKYI